MTTNFSPDKQSDCHINTRFQAWEWHNSLSIVGDGLSCNNYVDHSVVYENCETFFKVFEVVFRRAEKSPFNSPFHSLLNSFNNLKQGGQVMIPRLAQYFSMRFILAGPSNSHPTESFLDHFNIVCLIYARPTNHSFTRKIYWHAF